MIVMYFVWKVIKCPSSPGSAHLRASFQGGLVIVKEVNDHLREFLWQQRGLPHRQSLLTSCKSCLTINQKIFCNTEVHRANLVVSVGEGSRALRLTATSRARFIAVLHDSAVVPNGHASVTDIHISARNTRTIFDIQIKPLP